MAKTGPYPIRDKLSGSAAAGSFVTCIVTLTKNSGHCPKIGDNADKVDDYFRYRIVLATVGRNFGEKVIFLRLRR